MCVVGLWLKRLKHCPFERLHLDYWGTLLVCDEPRATTKPELIKNVKRSPTRIEYPLNRVWFELRLIFHWNKFNFLKALSPLRVWWTLCVKSLIGFHWKCLSHNNILIHHVSSRGRLRFYKWICCSPCIKNWKLLENNCRILSSEFF